MEYVCDRCKKEFNNQPGYLSYGFKKGEPFITKLCPDCKKSMTDEQVEEFKAQKGRVSISEELGILGQ